MGLFNRNFDRPGPGVSKDAPKKKGAARFFEIWMRDAGDIWRASALTLLCFVPCILGAAVLLIGRPYILPMLIGAVVYVAGSLLAGPALCGFFAVLVKMVRDEPGYMMHIYKKAWKENSRQSMPLGVLLMVLLALESWVAVYFLPTQGGGLSSSALFGAALFGLLVVLICGVLAVLQVLFMQLGTGTILKNSLLLFLGRAKRTLPAAMILLACWFVCMVLLNPLFVLVLALVGVGGLVGVIVVMWLWPVLDDTFSISERQAEKRAAAEAAEAAGTTAQTPAADGAQKP